MEINTNGNQREIKDLKIIQHAQTDVVNDEEILVDYVQYTVVGKHNEWRDWTPLDEFRMNNPEIDI